MRKNSRGEWLVFRDFPGSILAIQTRLKWALNREWNRTRKCYKYSPFFSFLCEILAAAIFQKNPKKISKIFQKYFKNISKKSDRSPQHFLKKIEILLKKKENVSNLFLSEFEYFCHFSPPIFYGVSGKMAF